MFSRILPSKIGLFELLESHAETGIEAAQAMVDLLRRLDEGVTARLVGRIEELEHECDHTVHMVVDLVRQSFIMPFDRDEVRTLISALDDVVDYIEAAAHRVDLYEIKTVPADLISLAEVLLHTQTEVSLLIKTLRTIRKQKNLDYQKHCREIQRLENDSDHLHRGGLAALFRDGLDPLSVIKLKELYEVLEAAVDSAEQVANIVEGIVIEHVG